MSDAPDDPDLAARKYAAAHDPAFPARREAGFAAILTALAAVLEPAGYTLRGSTFTRSGPRGKSAIHLQRSRYGWDAQILLRFLTPEGTLPPAWPEDADDLTLLHFAEDLPHDPGLLAFVDALDDPARLVLATSLLANRALPWLDSHH